jgi:glucoamylase
VATGSNQAPGAPGSPARWAPAGKTGVGTALSTHSPVWFTLSQGILTEVFYPFVDTACTRDLGLLVADGKDFFSEERVDTKSEVSSLAPGVPAFRLINTCKSGRYKIEKTILTDPRRAALLQKVQFTALKGQLSDYSLYALLAPHLDNHGDGNSAWVGQFKGAPMLFARRNGFALALACSEPWLGCSVGFVGVSDGWQDVSRHKKMTWHCGGAHNGNVALTGEIDLKATGGRFLLALGFGRDEWEAGHQARASLLQGFKAAREEYVKPWSEWLKGVEPLEQSDDPATHVYHVSTAVMRTHESKSFKGGIIASLATPWGFAHGDGDMGYHLIWPRDMIETVTALLAARRHEDARRVLFYFCVTQEADGHWSQNMEVSGRPWWNGIQLDETAFVILLVGLARREKALEDDGVNFLWPMIRRAASYLVRHGPVTPLDRWEEESGYFASTMAVEIPALLVAAELAEQHGEKETAAYLRETADAWNHSIESLIYVEGTDLARKAGVDGYYVRFAKPDQMNASAPAAGYVDLKNHLPGQGRIAIADLVSPDALALVRFGLRAADDPRIVNTLRVIDMLCKVDTPRGACWHRYNNDGYGETKNGAPFEGAGVGRVWPLLTGERAHYELAAGRKTDADKLRRAMEAFANDSGLLPEQIWDSPDIPDRDLFFGRPSGSAMPLVWAHGEYVKLRRSLHDGRVFDMPSHSVERYLQKKTKSPHIFWRFEQPCRALSVGKTLRLEVMAPAIVHWSGDGWRTFQDTPTRDTKLGVHVADLSTGKLAAGSEVVFTFYWPEAKRWEGKNFSVTVTAQVERPRVATPSPSSNGQKKAEPQKETKGKKKKQRR